MNRFIFLFFLFFLCKNQVNSQTFLGKTVDTISFALQDNCIAFSGSIFFQKDTLLIHYIIENISKDTIAINSEKRFFYHNNINAFHIGINVIHIGYKVPLQIIAPNESYSNIERINSTLGLSITNYDTITLYNDYSIIFQYVFFRREVVEVNKSFLAINTIPQGTNILEHTIDETFYINSQDFINNSKNIYSLNYALNSRKKNLNSIEIIVIPKI